MKSAHYNPHIFSLKDWEEQAEGILTEVAWIVESSAGIKRGNGLHLFLLEAKAEQVNVLLHPLRLGGLWNDGSASLDAPSEHNLSGSLTVLCGDFLDFLILEAAVLLSRHTQLDVGSRSKVAEAGDCDVVGVAESNEPLLSVVRVQLDLQDGWLDFGVAQDVSQQGDADVAHANGLDQTFLLEFLHSLPSFRVRDWILDHLHVLWVGEVDPLWRVAVLDWHELQRDGEVDQVQVEVLKAQVLQRLLTSHLHMLFPVSEDCGRCSRAWK